MSNRVLIPASLLIAVFTACSRGREAVPSPEVYREAVAAFYVGLSAIQTTQEELARQKLDRVVALVPEEPAGWANFAIQGLTLGAPSRALDLRDNDPVGHEVAAARERALRAGLAGIDNDQSALAEAVRQEFIAQLGPVDASPDEAEGGGLAHNDIHRRAPLAARQAIIAMRASERTKEPRLFRSEHQRFDSGRLAARSRSDTLFSVTL